MDYQDILVNLKVLEHVQVDEKLISNGQYLNIEYKSIVPVSLRRWYRQDNRNEMLKKIKLIIQNASDKLRHEERIEDSQNGSIILEGEIVENTQEILQTYLGNARKGLTNLKKTYAACRQTCAQIDVLISSIDQIVN